MGRHGCERNFGIINIRGLGSKYWSFVRKVLGFYKTEVVQSGSLLKYLVGDLEVITLNQMENHRRETHRKQQKVERSSTG